MKNSCWGGHDFKKGGKGYRKSFIANCFETFGKSGGEVDDKHARSVLEERAGGISLGKGTGSDTLMPGRRKAGREKLVQ